MHKTPSSLFFSFCTAVCCAFIAQSSTTTGDETIRFNRDVRPILADKCFACHGPDSETVEGDLRLDQPEQVKRNGGVIVAGDPEASTFIHRVFSHDQDEVMPPPETNKPLTDTERDVLRRWIDEGAVYEQHWSYTEMKKAPTDVPSVELVDHFIDSRLKQLGVEAAAPADRVTLIRRLSLDLTGIPPTIEEVDAFVGDTSPDAYQKLVDRLLASPRYGERLATFWLDLVRYADTIGYHSDNPMPVTFYRDYVIEAFNSNLPYDQFTREQLAGDLLPNPTQLQLFASGYNRLLQTTEEGGAQAKEYVAIYAADRVRNVSGVWMGATVGCAQCHDHKYDPYSMKDFYSLAAFFADIKENPVGGRVPNLLLPSEEQAHRLAWLRERLNESHPAEIELVKGAGKLSLLRHVDDLDLTGDILLAINCGGEGEAGSGPDVKGIRFLNDTVAGTLVDVSGDKKINWHDRQYHVGVSRASGMPLQPTIEGIRYSNRGRDHQPNTWNIGVWEDTHHYRTEGSFGDPGLEQVLEVTGTQNVGKGGDAPSARSVAMHFATARGRKYKLQLIFNWSREQGEDTSVNVWALPNTLEHLDDEVLRSHEPELASLRVNAEMEKLGHQPGNPSHDAALLWTWEFEAVGTSTGIEILGHESNLVDIAAVTLEDLGVNEHNPISDPVKTKDGKLIVPKREYESWEAEIRGIEETVPKMLVSESLDNPRVTRILPRGNWLDDSGEIVSPAIPEFLGTLQTGGRLATRLDLANWLCDPENPLTARTMVNRLWSLMFGRGICTSVDDFGGQGTYPSYPELLDALSVEFVESGWDIKHVFRLIANSRAYQRSSHSTGELRASDPYNDWFARQGCFRIDAEMVRDSALACSGLLVEQRGGNSVRPYQPAGYYAHLNFPPRKYQQDTGNSLYRRGVYTHWQRTFLHPMLKAFDAPSREECTARRSRSTTPLQALTLLNDPSFVEAARVFAQRSMMEGGGTLEDQIKWAYRSATSRKTNVEIEDLLGQLYEDHLEVYSTNPAAAKKLVKIGEAPVPKEADIVKLAAMTSVTRVILNLHECITRN